MKLGKIFICINIYYRFDEYNRTIVLDDGYVHFVEEQPYNPEFDIRISNDT